MANSLLYKTEHKINEHVSIRIPTIGEIINDDDYFANIALIISTPYDMMAQLDSINIDFTQINDWDLFCLLFKQLQTKDLSLIFGDLNLKEFETAVNKQNGNVVLLNKRTGAVIDRAIHDQICRFLRKLLRLEKNEKKPANDEAKKFMIERAKRKLKRKMKQPEVSPLEQYIVALVNTSEFPYNYDSVQELI